MSIRIDDPGTLTTVQDEGRYGYQDIGLPPAGAVDNFALRAGNILIGNNETEAGLEITYRGPTITFQNRCLIAITGGNLQPRLNGKSISCWESFLVEPSDKLSFATARSGIRAYITFSGGLKVAKVMGSRSTYLPNNLGGFKGRALKEGDVLEVGSSESRTTKRIPPKCVPDYKLEDIGAVPGPQKNHFSPEEINDFFSSTFQVSKEADRMGIILEGENIKHRKPADIISDPVPFGGVQVPGSGKPIVAMTDRQTTGGYAKIATVASPELDKLAQAKPGNKISFTEMSVPEAQKLLREKEQKISSLKGNLRRKDIKLTAAWKSIKNFWK